MVLRNEQFYKLSSLKCNEQLLKYILNKFDVSELSEHCTKQIKLVVKVFVTKLLTKWRSCNYMYERFNNKHMKWLDEDLKLPQIYSSSAPKRSEQKKRGKPRKREL